MISEADKSFYQQHISLALAKFGDEYSMTFLFPRVSWDLRGRSRLGMAGGNGMYIKLNAQYASLLGRDEYLQTVLHEVCHVVTTQRRPGPRPKSGPWSSHGAEWKRSMKFLGLKPDRCAEVPSSVLTQFKPTRRAVRHPVYCTCPQPHMVTTQMLAKINSGASCRCKACKVVVTPYKGVLTSS